MLPAERLEKIVQVVNEREFVSVTELLELFRASKPTIMRDLMKLEEQNLIQRTYGGATKIRLGTTFEPKHALKETHLKDEKDRIAQRATSFIFPGETILIDSGSTTLMLASHLQHVKNITIITNDIKIAMMLSDNEDINLVVLGGQRRKGVYSLIGPFTENFLQNLRVDKVFLGADAVDLNGIGNANMDEFNLKRLMIQIAHKVILLADSSKFNKVAFSKVADLDMLDVIITDGGIRDKGIMESIIQKNIQLEVV